MTNKQWINANLEGKVKARALRACDEQPNWGSDITESIADCFGWYYSKEGFTYWQAIFCKVPNPDKHLPENYLDVDRVPESQKIDYWVECNVCKSQLKNWAGSTPCCGSIAYVVEPTEMIEDKFLTWLESEIVRTQQHRGGANTTLRSIRNKYNELKTK
jgi:hypothetical protein